MRQNVKCEGGGRDASYTLDALGAVAYHGINVGPAAVLEFSVWLDIFLIR